MPKIKISARSGLSPIALVALVSVMGLVLFAQPAIAHHPFDGQTPTNFLEGFLSGLGHPVIGLDHFAFVVAVGLLSAIEKQGFLIPVAFVLAAIGGTGLHLMGLDLPLPELVISASVLAFGIVLAMKDRPQAIALAVLGAIAGIFHGYAYGESIVGAEMTPLVAYLAGFTIIQLIIALGGYKIGKFWMQKSIEQPLLNLRFAGFTICGAGAAFLAGAILG